MKKLLLLTAVAASLFSASTLSAGAQGFSVGVGPGGAGVEFNDGRRHRDWDRDRDYGRRERVYDDRGRGDCRTVVTRTRNYDGDLVVRRQRVCD